MVKNQTSSAKVVESKKSQNRKKKSDNSRVQRTQILQKNTFCIEWEDSPFVFFEGVQLFDVFPLFWCNLWRCFSFF